MKSSLPVTLDALLLLLTSGLSTDVGLNKAGSSSRIGLGDTGFLILEHVDIVYLLG